MSGRPTEPALEILEGVESDMAEELAEGTGPVDWGEDWVAFASGDPKWDEGWNDALKAYHPRVKAALDGLSGAHPDPEGHLTDITISALRDLRDLLKTVDDPDEYMVDWVGRALNNILEPWGESTD